MRINSALYYVLKDPLDSASVVTNANGNMVTRDINAGAMTGDYDLIYNAENRLVEVKKNSVSMATFVYDGDGRRVKSIINNETILFIGAHFEFNDTTDEVTKYYFAGSSRIAMRKYTVPQSMSVEYLLGDHLGSTSITTDANGTKVSEMRYKPWGEVRYSWTTTQSTTPAYSLTDYTFTGQFSYMDDPSTTSVTEGFGLMFYVSRFYDPALGRFTSADSIIPGGVQGYDRYAYVNNSPVNFTDPNGHKCEGVSVECLKPDGSKGGGFTGGNSSGSTNKPNNSGEGGQDNPSDDTTLGNSNGGCVPNPGQWICDLDALTEDSSHYYELTKVVCPASWHCNQSEMIYYLSLLHILDKTR